MSRGPLLRQAATGLGVAFLVGFVPIVQVAAPFIGGIVAGYRFDEGPQRGATVGAVVGVLWTIATAALLVVVAVGAAVSSPAHPFGWIPIPGGPLRLVGLFFAINAVVTGLTTLGGTAGGALAARRRS